MGLLTTTPAWGTLCPRPDGVSPLPAAGLEQLARVERLRRDADHRLTEAGRHAGQDVRVLVVRRRLDDRLRAPLGITRLEDPRADEDAVGAELHAERCVRGRGDPAGCEGH